MHNWMMVTCIASVIASCWLLSLRVNLVVLHVSFASSLMSHYEAPVRPVNLEPASHVFENDAYLVFQRDNSSNIRSDRFSLFSQFGCLPRFLENSKSCNFSGSKNFVQYEAKFGIKSVLRMLCQAIQVPSCTFSTNMDILRPNSRYFGSIFTIFEAMGMTKFWWHFNLLYKKSCSRCEGSSNFNNCKTTRFKDKKKHKCSGGSTLW